MTATNNKSNLFGDVRAEQDHEMLGMAFHEWQNYLTLIESKDRFIVVGRRGTGKSALTYKLRKNWEERKIKTLVISPNEEEVIGLRGFATLLGSSVSLIRAGIKILWRYALLLEIAEFLASNYKLTAEVASCDVLISHLRAWKAKGDTPLEKLRVTMRETLKNQLSPEERIGELSKTLQLSRISEDISNLIQESNRQFSILIDRLDEGYTPDTLGVGIVDGLIYGTDEIRKSLGSHVSATMFLRDNLFRAVQSADQDFSRNIEGQFLRLHWDPEELFYMVTKRIRSALSITTESDIKVWNSITSNELHGRDGFKKCLRSTLYRPRDVIHLMNTAYFHAKRQQRTTLIPSDFSNSAKQISTSRFDDLEKEYNSVFPGISTFTRAFLSKASRLSVQEASSIIEKELTSTDIGQSTLQHAKILGNAEEIIKALYGIGFFGVLSDATGTFIFSFDGKQPNREISKESILLIHPCYWAALNINDEISDEYTAENIFDEYEINITSESKESREKKLGKLISELSNIKPGNDQSAEFESWCKRAIEIAFAKELTNIELKPNKNATQRRDIVATNDGITGFWKRIREDYQTRQVVFEVKNYESLGIDEYRQASAYLGREYGKLAFIICRDSIRELSKGRDLDAFKEIYDRKEHVIIKLTASALVSILSKLRSPQKYDAGDVSLEKLLDTHIRLFANGQQATSGKKSKKRKSKSDGASTLG